MPNEEGYWELEDGRTLALLTPAELKECPPGTVLHDIEGVEAVVGRDAIDGDTRYGYLAYGQFIEVPSR